MQGWKPKRLENARQIVEDIVYAITERNNYKITSLNRLIMNLYLPKQIKFSIAGN